jgi:cell division protein FtsW
MVYQFEPEGRLKNRADPLLVASVILLTGLGLVVLYSASFPFAQTFFEDGYYFIRRQIMFCVFGILLFVTASSVPLGYVRKAIAPLLFGTFVLCLLTFLPGIGDDRSTDARRWINIMGYTYQPSELVKVVLPIYLAHIFAKKQDEMEDLLTAVIPPALVSFLFFFIICMQNNFSTAIFIFFNAMVVFFMAGVRLRHFFSGLALMLPISVYFILTKEHRFRRVLSFVWPDWEPLRAGYQRRASILSIESGSLFGRGIGQGVRKIADVPEIHSDFIFAAYAEETGLLGVIAFFFVFGLFAYRGYKAALRTGDCFKRLLAISLVTAIISQCLLNVAVTAGALPVTGVPLPFFSAGGSSLATTLLAAGLIVNVSRDAGEEGCQ